MSWVCLSACCNILWSVTLTLEYSVDGFHSIFSLGNWRALHHHAPCWLVNIHMTRPFCPPVSMVRRCYGIHLYCSMLQCLSTTHCRATQYPIELWVDHEWVSLLPGVVELGGQGLQVASRLRQLPLEWGQLGIPLLELLCDVRKRQERISIHHSVAPTQPSDAAPAACSMKGQRRLKSSHQILHSKQ